MSDNGSVELYEDNVKRLETSVYGVTVTGTVNADSSTLTHLTVDSADIRQLSVDFINADSAFMDSATITSIASNSINTNALQVDDITIDGSTISDGATLTVDAGGQIVLDADGGLIQFKDGGTEIAQLKNSSSDFQIISIVQDKDIIFRGNDGGSYLNALTLDMSDAGTAIFNKNIKLGHNQYALFGDDVNDPVMSVYSNGTDGKIEVSGGGLQFATPQDITLDANSGNIKLQDGGTEIGEFQLNDTNHLKLGSKVQDADIRFFGNDGGSTITPLILDMSDAGKAIFGAGGITTSGTIRVGNLNVDSADIGLIAREKLSTGNPDALTYDSAAGQFGLNANHVMALIQTVDSNGSGLNAATLDGQEGTHYRINVYNNSGTLLN